MSKQGNNLWVKLVMAGLGFLIQLTYSIWGIVIINKEVSNTIVSFVSTLITLIIFDTIKSSKISTNITNRDRVEVTYVSDRRNTLEIEVHVKISSTLLWLVNTLNLGYINIIINTPVKFTLTPQNDIEIEADCIHVLDSRRTSLNVVQINKLYPEGLYLKYTVTSNNRSYTRNQLKTQIEIDSDSKFKKFILSTLMWFYVDTKESSHKLVAGEG